MGTVRYTVIDGEIVEEKRNGVHSTYVPDPLGSTVALLDNTQTKSDTFSYWPYGENDGRTGTTPTPFQFVGTAGYYRDAADRTSARRRTLKTALGRWLTPDPTGIAGGFNYYAYGMGSPTSFTDMSGLIVTTSPWDAARLADCRRMLPGACHDCAQYYIRYGTPQGLYQGDYIACVRANAFCHSHINCEITSVRNPVAPPRCNSGDSPGTPPPRGWPGFKVPIGITLPAGGFDFDFDWCISTCEQTIGKKIYSPGLRSKMCHSFCATLRGAGCEALEKRCAAMSDTLWGQACQILYNETCVFGKE